jgi:hypothetical protein
MAGSRSIRLEGAAAAKGSARGPCLQPWMQVGWAQQLGSCPRTWPAASACRRIRRRPPCSSPRELIPATRQWLAGTGPPGCVRRSAPKGCLRVRRGRAYLPLHRRPVAWHAQTRRRRACRRAAGPNHSDAGKRGARPHCSAPPSRLAIKKVPPPLPGEGLFLGVWSARSVTGSTPPGCVCHGDGSILACTDFRPRRLSCARAFVAEDPDSPNFVPPGASCH